MGWEEWVKYRGNAERRKRGKTGWLNKISDRKGVAIGQRVAKKLREQMSQAYAMIRCPSAMSPGKNDQPAARICVVRSRRVILDADLARIYGTTTSAFNQAIRRNRARFPADFAFQLTAPESVALHAQIAEYKEDETMWSQIVTTSKPQRRRLGNRPWVFTEHGAVMAANVLRSARAVEMSVYVVRAFILQRETLATNGTILKRLAEIDRTLLEHDTALQTLWKKLQPLLAPPPEPSRRRIGFHPGNADTGPDGTHVDGIAGRKMRRENSNPAEGFVAHEVTIAA
jgi:hypothetical protein